MMPAAGGCPGQRRRRGWLRRQTPGATECGHGRHGWGARADGGPGPCGERRGPWPPVRETVMALAGNPNSGKSTVFNVLTGGRQHVGNWPGVTVEKKEGLCARHGRRVRVVDLPGVYSLTAYSPDEVVARDFIIDQRPDVVVDVVDASNLERSLYLTVQLMELDVPLVVALNMMDEAETKGHRIDVAALSRELRVPVVPTTASRDRGMTELFETVLAVADGRVSAGGVKVALRPEVEVELRRLEVLLADSPLAKTHSARWLALKLLENDEEVAMRFWEVQGVR